MNRNPLDDLAESVGKFMLVQDQASKGLGMQLLEIHPGFAKVTMTVRSDMVNGFGICHGGVIFSLADSAFAFASNSRNHCTVAAGCSIEFLAPVNPGDILIAEAREQIIRKRTGVYDVMITNQNEERIAMFRGKSHRLNQAILSTEICQPAETTNPNDNVRSD